MTKSELMENYTMEQLAEMVVKYQNHFDTFKFADSLAKTELFSNPAIAACESRIEILQKENEILKSQLDRKQNEINQIDENMNKLFGVTHDVVKKPDEFERILKEKADGYKTISDFLPTEPIKVADTLINAKVTYNGESLDWLIEDFKKFGISELWQIAEHLLVYCRANESEGEE